MNTNCITMLLLALLAAVAMFLFQDLVFPIACVFLVILHLFFVEED